MPPRHRPLSVSSIGISEEQARQAIITICRKAGREPPEDVLRGDPIFTPAVAEPPKPRPSLCDLVLDPKGEHYGS